MVLKLNVYLFQLSRCGYTLIGFVFVIDIEQCLTQKPYECVTESLRGARVLVTGASTGIGEQMAYHYAHFGAQIVITARRGKVLQQVSESVNIYKPMFYPVAEQLCICICKVL